MLRSPERWLCAGLALTAVACSERSAVQGGAQPSPDAGSAADVQGKQLELIDDMDHLTPGYPGIPAGTPGFYWHSPNTLGLGNWFVSSPASAIHDARVDAIVPARADSQKAIHVTGDGSQTGVDLWAQLDHPQGRAADLSAFDGIAFWARLDSPSGRLVVGVGDEYFSAQSNNVPVATTTVAVPAAWHRVELSFRDFAGDVSAVRSIDFVIDVGAAFDLWIDDLALVCRGACP